jgi:hypothetical protein
MNAGLQLNGKLLLMSAHEFIKVYGEALARFAVAQLLLISIIMRPRQTKNPSEDAHTYTQET